MSLSLIKQAIRDNRGRLDIRRQIPNLLLLLGILLLGYVALQYGRMYQAQRQLSQEWSQQNSAWRAANRNATATAAAAQEQSLIRLSAPTISLDAVVVEGTSEEALLLGPGHMVRTAIPGDSGNSVISGHRDTFFRHIHELNKGDVILVQRNGRAFRFEVTGKKVVEPTDLSVIQPTGDSRLTLITCYPTYYIGPAPQRLVVFSKLVQESPPRQERTQSHGGSSDSSFAAAGMTVR